MLQRLVPTATIMAVLINPTSPSLTESTAKDAQAAARKLGVQLHLLHASTASDLDDVFATVVHLRVGAFVVGPDAFFFSRRDQIAELATRYAMPAIYYVREFAAAGGLMSYGVSVADGYRLAGVYVGRILRGATERLASPGVDEVRASHQPKDCQDARPRRATRASRHCGRGDRLERDAQEKMSYTESLKL